MNIRDTQPWKSRMALLAIYLLLAALLTWAATAPLNRFTGTLAALIVLGCWVPGYVYVNRSDIRSNRVFWISHGVAFVATAALCVIIMPNQVDVDDAIQKQARSQGHAKGLSLYCSSQVGCASFSVFVFGPDAAGPYRWGRGSSRGSEGGGSRVAISLRRDERRACSGRKGFRSLGMLERARLLAHLAEQDGFASPNRC